jgi:hypothetical protein
MHTNKDFHVLNGSKTKYQHVMSAESIQNFFSNLSDRSITVCESCTEQQILDRRQPSDLGYCFYRPHEALYASQTGILYLTWGSYKMDERVILIIVEAIKDEARACNLDVSWKGSVKDRVIIRNLEKQYFNRFA